jgi:hypothetical protein
MTLETLKQEMESASPEVRNALFYHLLELRRRDKPGQEKNYAAMLDDPSRWVSEEEAARRLGIEDVAEE